MHQPRIQQGPSGQVSDVEIHARELAHIKRRMNEIFAARTGQPYEKVERDTDRDRIMSPGEAVEYGVIDGIVGHAGVAQGTRARREALEEGRTDDRARRRGI